jgi:uncharacterized protein
MTNSGYTDGTGGARHDTGAQRFEVPRWECYALLRHEGVGRLCIIDHGCPVAFPVNYRMEGDDAEIRAVVRTAPGTLMGEYEGPASLEVDHIDLAAGTAWSVIVRGTAQHVIGTHTLPDPHPLVADGRDRWIQLRPSMITGRRFTVKVSADGFPVEWSLVTG